ncbi:ATP-binding protein [Hyphobacterium sp. HN65]|uniref:histidine kinase n=1 Tax=Hyphobacterium lacteum TaxID=3116575 RepID=A0ABU7LR88_9PROT|nr:ATP-binding protein [Hyphobacterium sp. HN65]MEE2526429.1 ATP-binding protein [Hyphobacterium sp. HN65]
MKRYLPKSLFGRSLLIFVVPVAVMQGLIAWAFFEQHWETVTSRLSEGVAGDVAIMTELFESVGGNETAFEPLADAAYRNMQLSVDFREGELLPTSRRSSFFRTLDRTLRRSLTAAMDNEVWFDTTRYPAYVDIRVQTDNGVLRFIAVRERVFATTGHIFLLWLFGATAVLSLVSVIFIRNQVKPIRRLADAAKQFGRGEDAGDFKPAGAREVREAAHAFIDMRQRISRHLEQRTSMLAGVSHDLRTPLTRLKLQLALLPESEEREEAIRDLSEMEHMLEEYLAFARGQVNEETVEADVSAIVAETVEAARRADPDIALTADEGLLANVRPGVLKRGIANLISNACAYGNTCEVSVRRGVRRLEIIVDDDGPGIPEDQREEAFKPFARLDEARNMNREGVGLGLAIARDVARGHGGEVDLSDSPLGGLRAIMRLPLA